ncbi:MAG: DUF885 family protein, partial [Acidobacteriaceae bacterium]|nr:DUF885 family protein [Acidobacteriaceae bacterium]
MRPRIWRKFASCLVNTLTLSVLTAGLLPARAGEISTFVEEFVKSSLALSPSQATTQGYHEHHGVVLDEQVEDYSPAQIQRARDFYRHALEQSETLNKTNPVPEDAADLEIIRLQCESALLELDRIQSYRHNPTVYVEMIGTAIYAPFVLEYAPEHRRIEQIIARLERIPAVIASARHNLENAPEVWNRVAQGENQGNIDLIESIRSKVPQDLRARYDGAAQKALGALKEFNTYLRGDLSKRTNDWRLAKEVYAQKFRLTLATGETPRQALAAAETRLGEIREDMRKQASVVFAKFFSGETPPHDLDGLVGKVLDKIAQQHTTPANYFDDAKRDLAEATAFVTDRHLLALPRGGNLQVIPTPEFVRGIYGVGGFAPAPVLQPELKAYYWITPFTPDMSTERVESKLREYNNWGLQILTIHEAMPGHYVQAEYASRIDPKWRGALRAIYGNVPYVEGWAVYATELLINQGYVDTPEMRLTFGKQMLRVVANTILD